jgi:putative nucleotidyltransferase with HDIG domain
VAAVVCLALCIAITSVFLVHLFERIFHITTDLRLMELSDFNHPLLRKLSEFAPGTFHHSIQVGNYAELAAERIGANALLVRIMALYHDIGKTVRPEYFTENKRGDYNPHDGFGPRQSATVLVAHVTLGKVLADEYRLPDPIVSGILEHHGNNTASFFYEAALKEALRTNPDAKLSPKPFSYPGPRPQSKETAILMLADGIEATSRAMASRGDRKPGDFAAMVHRTIQMRLSEGQLADSGLTNHVLGVLEQGFLLALEGSNHARIQYPQFKFGEPGKAAPVQEELNH